MNWNELIWVALRTIAVYLVILIVVRIMGNRELGTLGAFDFLVALMIGEVVDEAIYGNVSMLKFILVVVLVAALEIINSFASYKNKFLRKLLAASPTRVVIHGKLQREDLARERISEDDRWSQLRMNGIDELKMVKEATIEPNGQISVVLEDWARAVQKSDLALENKTNG